MKSSSIAVILYGNLDHYPSTISAVRLLENDNNVVIFSRNVDGQHEIFGKNTVLYRFGKYSSVREREKKNGLSKLTEFILFLLRTIHHSIKHGCGDIIAYDSYSFTTTMILKLFNPHTRIFYHGHEIIELSSSRWYNLRHWMDKFTLQHVKKCVWVSQPDVKRARFFGEMAGIKDVKVVRNFAPRNFKYPTKKHPLCEELRKAGYTIVVYTGTIGRMSYIQNLAEFVIKSEINIAIVAAGFVLEEGINRFLKSKDPGKGRSKFIHLGFLPRREMHVLLNSADFALVLYEPSFITEMSAGSSAKVGEYIASGLPVVYPSFWDYEPYYKEIGLSYNDGRGLIKRIEQMAGDQVMRRKFSENAKRLLREKINFESEVSELKGTIDRHMRDKEPEGLKQDR